MVPPVSFMMLPAVISGLVSTSSKEKINAFLKRVAQNVLIAQAATSYQREVVFYFTPSVLANADFDGVSAGTAMHLLELH